jgi:hypothetical protein
MDAKHIANGLLKDSPIEQRFKTIQIFHRSWILHFKQLSKVFNEDDGSWDKMIQSV